MDAAIQAILTLSLFAAVHERALELVRHIADQLLGVPPPPDAQGRIVVSRVRWIVDQATIGPSAVVLAVGIAIATHANLLALFAFDGGKTTSKFFELYLQYGEGTRFLEARDVMGCVLMGFAAALGSRFWHDLAYGLVDLRGQAQAAKNPVLAPPAAASPGIHSPKPAETVVAAAQR
jgi:hypothetical protein